MGTNYKVLKEQVQELLNQIALLTKDMPKPQQRENYNYQLEAITSSVYEDLLSDAKHDPDNEDLLNDVEGKPIKKPNDDAIYLYAVGEYVKRVIDGDVDSATHNENQYYNSNC